MAGDRSRYAVLFPGQGSQFVGMGEDLFGVLPYLLGEAADGILGWSLRDLCLQGPEEELTRTDRAQPALYALSLAAWEMLRRQVPTSPAAAAGHSLGEYTALAAAGAMAPLDGLRLVATRGRAMASAAAAEPSGMAALIGADGETAEALAAARRDSGGRLWVANVNAPGQVVVAGGRDDIAWAVDHGRDHGVRRVVPLKVAGAFHSPFMEGAVAEIEAAVAALSFRPLRFPVWANATALPYGEDDVGELLVRQVTAPVRFADTLSAMAASGVDTFVHVGPGDVTAGLAARSIDGARVFVVATVEDAERVAAALAA